MDTGAFREDLYFRLGAFIITVPPLRERREDIPPLVHAFMVRAATRMKKDVRAVSADAMSALMNYRWPGNVRNWQRGDRAALIERMRQRAEAAGVPFSSRVQHGDPAGVILLHARAIVPDLIVLGSHRKTGLERLRVGSVAERVALRAVQPTLIVPAPGRALPIRPVDSILVGWISASRRGAPWSGQWPWPPAPPAA